MSSVDSISLGYISSFVGGVGFPIKHQGKTEEKYPFYKVSSLSQVDTNEVILDRRNTVSSETAALLGARIVPAGGILFAKIGEAIRLARFRWASTDCCIDNNMLALVVNPSLAEPRFLKYCLTQLKLEDFINLGPVPSLNLGKLSRWPVRFLPLDTQRRIAEYLDTETAQIDTMMAKLDELVELLGERREAQLLSSFFASDDSSAQSLWPMSHLGAHSEVVSRGVAPAYVDEDGLRVINQKCVRPGGLIDFSRSRQHNLAKKSIKGSLYLQEGDVVVNSTGTGTLGRSALVTELSEPTILDGHVTLVRPNGSSLLGAFLAYFLRAQEQWLIREARGSTNQIELGKDTLLTMPVPLPPLDEQRRIAERLDTVTARIDTMIDKCNELRDLLKERRAALITAVVTGQKEVPHV